MTLKELEWMLDIHKKIREISDDIENDICKLLYGSSDTSNCKCAIIFERYDDVLFMIEELLINSFDDRHRLIEDFIYDHEYGTKNDNILIDDKEYKLNTKTLYSILRKEI